MSVLTGVLTGVSTLFYWVSTLCDAQMQESKQRCEKTRVLTGCQHGANEGCVHTPHNTPRVR